MRINTHFLGGHSIKVHGTVYSCFMLQATLGAEEHLYDQYTTFKLFEGFPEVSMWWGYVLW